MDDIEAIKSKLKFNDKELIPAVVQDINTREVLMVAYMNEKALEKTLETEKACFWSRSREKLWLKGETSGNYQKVKDIRIDCDRDTLLLLVEPEGPACHTGNQSCFYRTLNGEEISSDEFLKKAGFLKKLYNIIKERKNNLPEDSYTTYLYSEGIDKIGKKIGEEATEVVIACKNENNEQIVYESSDLIYHLMVALVLYDISLEEIFTELKHRH
ncbi:MAG: bifunctional phosphoribosyl-AMP cyclohydrolase/phosphoribosyl-ATP diphosphatase HisIE [Halanaerobiaceae bacterium]